MLMDLLTWRQQIVVHIIQHKRYDKLWLRYEPKHTRITRTNINSLDNNIIPYSRKFLQGSIFADGRILFAGLSFVDAYTHAHYVPYNQAYFVGSIFTIRRSSTNTAKIGPLENFPLYSISSLNIVHHWLWLCVHSSSSVSVFQYCQWI